MDRKMDEKTDLVCHALDTICLIAQSISVCITEGPQSESCRRSPVLQVRAVMDKLVTVASQPLLSQQLTSVQLHEWLPRST